MADLMSLVRGGIISPDTRVLRVIHAAYKFTLMSVARPYHDYVLLELHVENRNRRYVSLDWTEAGTTARVWGDMANGAESYKVRFTANDVNLPLSKLMMMYQTAIEGKEYGLTKYNCWAFCRNMLKQLASELASREPDVAQQITEHVSRRENSNGRDVGLGVGGAVAATGVAAALVAGAVAGLYIARRHRAASTDQDEDEEDY